MVTGNYSCTEIKIRVFMLVKAVLLEEVGLEFCYVAMKLIKDATVALQDA